MKIPACTISIRRVPLVVFFTLLTLFSAPILAAEYESLQGLKGLDTVFDYGNGSPEEALVVFPAIREVYQAKAVTSLPNPSQNVIVFHNHAVKFLTTARTDDVHKNATLDKVAAMIRQFKKDGVRMVVCMYAVNVFGMDPETILPEIEKVPNGFISVSAYQAKGYSVIAIP